MTTKEKELEELREAEVRRRIVVETVADVVVTIDEGRRILFANGAAGKVFGYGGAELLGGGTRPDSRARGGLE